MMLVMKKPAKKKAPKKDAAQTALSAVEKAIGGKLANGSIEKRTKPRR
jgi:hypothetical protein